MSEPLISDERIKEMARWAKAEGGIETALRIIAREAGEAAAKVMDEWGLEPMNREDCAAEIRRRLTYHFRAKA